MAQLFFTRRPSIINRHRRFWPVRLLDDPTGWANTRAPSSAAGGRTGALRYRHRRPGSTSTGETRRRATMGQARDAADRMTAAATTSRDLEALAACYSENAGAVTPDQGEITGREGITEV